MTYTTQQVAELLDLSIGQVRFAIQSGRLKAAKVGRRLLVGAPAIAEYRRYLAAQSETAWRRAGRKVRPGEQPVGYRRGEHCTYAVYAEDQTKPLRRIESRPPFSPNPDDLDQVLAAIFTVNRSAKRRREAAASCYRSRVHSFAGHHREIKEYLYALRVPLCAEGCRHRLRRTARHVVSGRPARDSLRVPGRGLLLPFDAPASGSTVGSAQ